MCSRVECDSLEIDAVVRIDAPHTHTHIHYAGCINFGFGHNPNVAAHKSFAYALLAHNTFIERCGAGTHFSHATAGDPNVMCRLRVFVLNDGRMDATIALVAQR